MSSTPFSHPSEPEYAWEIATLFPEQGNWSEEAYLELTDGTNKLVEFTDGRLEFLPMPTEIHQELAKYLFLALHEFVERRGLGKVHFSGLRLRIRPRKIRQPDVLFLHKDNFHSRHNRVWDGADLVMEVVSPDAKDRKRDYEEKLADYAEGNVAEYWIADFESRRVIVHHLRDGRYVVHGEYAPGEVAASVILDGFGVDVSALFAVANDVPE